MSPSVSKAPARGLRLLRWLFWLTAATVLTLALMPTHVPMPSTGWDKVNHALAFAVLGLQGWLCWRSQARRVLWGLLAYGVAIEVLQSFTPSRSAEWQDLLADAAGLAIGWMALRLLAPQPVAQRNLR